MPLRKPPAKRLCAAAIHPHAGRRLRLNGLASLLKVQPGTGQTHSRKDMMKQISTLLALAAAVLVCGGTAARADEAAKDERFGDWVLHCTEISKGDTACALHQKIASETTKAPVAAFAIAFNKDSKELRLTAVLPLGLDIAAGVAGKVNEVPLAFAVQTCVRRGCVANVTVDEKLLDTLRGSDSFTATFKMRSVRDPVKVAVSLKGLHEGLKALEAR